MIKEATKYLILLVLITLLSCLSGSCILAQGENNNWAFGNCLGLSFNSGNPVLFKTALYSKEGCAAISDAFGNLLFYTSGSMIWDRNGNRMSHGNILGNGVYGSGTQAALILKSLANPDEYYLFTLDPQEVAIGANPKMRYSVVDMRLNDGLGDVKVGQKDIVLDDEMEERMYAVEADDCGYWIVGHKRKDNRYVAFKLTSAGLSGPVYSMGTFAGFFYGSDPGEIKISPDGTKIALIFLGGSYEKGFGTQFRIEIGEFDKRTGLISNTAILDSAGSIPYQGYGLAFSPDNQKLYATMEDYSQLVQYDLAFYPNISAVKNSRVKIAESNYMNFFGLRLGPDNKIYLANFSEGYISCIQNPNEKGLGCDFNNRHTFVDTAYYFYHATDPNYGFGFGNPTVALGYKDTLPGRSVDTVICFLDSVLLKVENNLLHYTWNDGVTGSSRYVHENGAYYCLSTKECTMRMDTFNLQFVKGNLSMAADTIICPGDSLVLRVRGEGFRWQDGSTDSVYVIRNAGVYSVRIKEKGCSFSDSIQVGIYQAGAFIAEGDTLICKGEELVLHGLSNPGGQLVWSTGSDLGSIPITVPGSYILEAKNICGTFLDSVYVDIQDCDCRPFIPNAFSPNGDEANDEFKVILDCYPQQFSFSVYNRYGQIVFSTYRLEEGWKGMYGNVPADVGTYYYLLQYRTPLGVSITYKGDIVLIR